MKKYSQKINGFTLIELMVVIAIIGILAALLFPVLSWAKARAYRTQCVNNFKQLGAAMQMYTDEHSDQLPEGACVKPALHLNPAAG